MIEQNPNYPEYIEKEYIFNITPGQNPERIDVFLSNNIRNATRTKVRQAIDEGYVLINGKKTKANKKIQPGDEIVCKILKPPPIELVPENIPLNIIFEDEHLIVVNKAAGMVTHPAFGNRYGTLVNAVLYHVGFRNAIPVEINEEEEENEFSSIFLSDALRPGVVHRLDKDTTGLIVISKNPVVHAALADQFAQRTIKRFYYALVWGNLKDDHGIIETKIGRSPRDRKLFAVVKKDGKEAKTEYWKVSEYLNMDLIKVKLWTGRTHQIRVHFSDFHHPVVGDQSYGGNSLVYGGNDDKFKKIAKLIFKKANRQMLHAKVLGFRHPVTGKNMEFESELPDDFAEVLNILNNYNNFL